MLSLGACSNFLDTDPDDILNDDDYITEESEIYTGFLGVISKMQSAGEQAVIVSDLRADFLEPGVEAPSELWQIYNYGNTVNNDYADPTCYYAVIVACNDYFSKLAAYKAEVGDNLEETVEKHYEALISSTIRIKVWAYLHLARTYGKAIWFDDPLTEIKDLSESKTFIRLNSPAEIVTKCLELMENGHNGIDGSLEMKWGEWLDPENPSNTTYDYWKYVVPDYLCLYSELRLWRGQQEDFEWVREHILQYLFEEYTAGGSSNFLRLCASINRNYYRIFNANYYYGDVTITTILFDYDNKQTNRLGSFFQSTSQGGKYYLKPSSYGVSTNHYKNGKNDLRMQDAYMIRVFGTDTCVYKYLSGKTLYKGDASIYIYRTQDLHFMLAEAEAHLGNFDIASCLLNSGVSNRFVNEAEMDAAGWDERYKIWLKGPASPSLGICGVVGATTYDLPITTDTISREELIKQYDLALMNEYNLEFYCEGKAFGNMVRIAQRYNDYKIMADRICPKYPAAIRSSIRSLIESGDCFVEWDLQAGDIVPNDNKEKAE